MLHIFSRSTMGAESAVISNLTALDG